MTWDILVEWMKLLGGTAAFVVMGAWLTRSLVLHWLSKDIERHKSQLKYQADRDIDLVRNELRQAGFQFEKRFGFLHEQMAKTLIDCYPLLVDVKRSVQSYLSVMEWTGEPPKEEKLKLVREKVITFDEFFSKKRLLFPKHLATMIDETLDVAMGAIRDFRDGLERERSSRQTKDPMDHWSKAFATVREKIKPLFEAMDDEIQRLLGFEHMTPSETKSSRAPSLD
ncbi:MAG: hypothetical protein ACJ8C4_15125 [Gemmataceae bacterium]